MAQSIEELQKDLEELKEFHSKSLREANKTLLEVEIKRLSDQIAKLIKLKYSEAKTGPAPPKRYISELTQYAWDQSDKFVKIFITLDNIQEIQNADDNVTAEFTKRSLIVTVTNFKEKDYSFTVNNLLADIVVEKSYKKVKSDMIAVYLKKEKEGFNWSHLTITAKQLKDIKDSSLKGTDNDPSDPTSSLMNLMKKMYETGSPEMKQTIAKAWQEGEEKRRKGEFDQLN